ncbi:hypothetical protein [Yersinia enterocolitica]
MNNLEEFEIAYNKYTGRDTSAPVERLKHPVPGITYKYQYANDMLAFWNAARAGLIAQLEAAQKERDEFRLAFQQNEQAKQELFAQKDLLITANLNISRRAEKAEAELSAANEKLKGEQVPVEYQYRYHNHGTGCGEWCRVLTKERYEELQREHAGDNDFVFRMLFTAPQKPINIDASVIRDANRYRFLRDEDSWGEDSDSWDWETKTGLISWENLCDVRLDDFDAAIDARMAASDIPPFNVIKSGFTVEGE